MTREVDRRDFSASRIMAKRVKEITKRAEEVSAGLSDGHKLRVTKFDPTTGNAALVGPMPHQLVRATMFSVH